MSGMKVTLHEDPYTCMIVSRSVLRRTKKMFQIKVLEEIKARVLCSVTLFFFFENCAIYEMWKNIVDWDRPIWRFRIACRITKSTN